MAYLGLVSTSLSCNDERSTPVNGITDACRGWLTNMPHTSLSIIHESLHRALVRVLMMGNQNVGNPHTFIQMIRCGVVYQPYVLISLWHRKILDQQFYFEPCHPEVLSLHNLENPVLGHLSHLWVCNVELFIPLGWPRTFKVNLQPVASYFLVAAGESEVYQTEARMIITPDGRNRMPQYA